MASGSITSWQIDGETMETVFKKKKVLKKQPKKKKKKKKQPKTLFSWAPKSMQVVTLAMKVKDACSLEEKLRSTSVQFSSVQSLSHVRLLVTP